MKVLAGKSYGSIGHLPNSRRGPGDKGVHEGQARIACVKPRDKHDLVIVQEKLDGSNVGVVQQDGKIIAVGRAGYSAASSPFLQHRYFALWVAENEERFRALLQEGERVCGEWLAQAHGTRYELKHEPFVAFDIMRGKDRVVFAEFSKRVAKVGLTMPHLLHSGGPLTVEEAIRRLGDFGHHGAIDPAEGVVWRVERNELIDQKRGNERAWKVDFLAKFVRPGKVDGCYLPEISGGDAIWYWQPKGAAQSTT